MRFAHRRAEELEEGESYYVSMTDMMVGVVFIFIIMLSYFALQYRQTTVSLTRPLQNATLAAESGGDPIMTLPADAIFVPGGADLSDNGRAVASGLATTIATRVSCSSLAPVSSDCAAVGRINRVIVIVRLLEDTKGTADHDGQVLASARARTLGGAILRAHPELNASGKTPMLWVMASVVPTPGLVTPASRVAVRFFGAK